MHELGNQAKMFSGILFCFQRMVGEMVVREAVKRFRARAAGYGGAKYDAVIDAPRSEFEIEIARFI